jgi:hypothetical protein
MEEEILLDSTVHFFEIASNSTQLKTFMMLDVATVAYHRGKLCDPILLC